MTAALGSIEEHGYQFLQTDFLALAPEQLLQIRECIPSDGRLTSVSEIAVSTKPLARRTLPHNQPATG
jgi:hypothetical protein